MGRPYRKPNPSSPLEIEAQRLHGELKKTQRDLDEKTRDLYRRRLIKIREQQRQQ